MAMLKDSVISGSARVTDSLLTTTMQTNIVKAPTTSGGTTYGVGTNGQVLKSNGTTVYWGQDNDTTSFVANNQGAGNSGKFLTVNSSGNVVCSNFSDMVTSRSSSDLTASGATVTAPAGYYASAATKTIASGSATTPATTISVAPSISVNANGLITASNSKTQSVTPTVSAGYVSSGTAGTITVSGSNTSQLSAVSATTYTPTTSNQTIASGKYTTGVQTILGDADLTAANIKKGVGIFGVTGTFTTTPSGKTALTAAALRSGYAGFINGSQVNGSMADTSVTEGKTTVSSSTATRGTWSQTAGYTAARTLSTATFANTATSGHTYVDISATTAAPVLVAGDYLYIDKGWTDDLKISLARLVPDGSDVKGHGDYILTGHSAYDNDGTLVAGTIATLVASDVTVSGKTVTIPTGKYTGGTSISKSVADGAYSASVSSHSISTAPKVTGKITGTGTNIGTTTKPSGTDGTDYWTFTPGGDATNGVSTAKGKATIGTAGYIAAGNTESSAHTVSIAPTAANGTTRYLAKATSSKSNGTASATANAGTASIAKQPSASATATANGMNGGYYTDSTTSSYYVDCSASAASGYSTATGGSASASVTASSVTVGAGYNPSSVTASTTASSTGNKTGNTATSTEVTASQSKKIYFKAAGISWSGGGLTNTTNYSGTPTVSVAIDSQSTSGIGITDTAQSSGYYVKLTGSTAKMTGSTKVTRADYKETRTAGYLPARAETTILSSTTSSPSVTVNAASKTRYLTLPTATFAVSANKVYCSAGGWVPTGSTSSVIGTVATGTISNNQTLPSGTSSSGTITRGKYIKVGAGYYASDTYYLAQNVSNGTITNNTTLPSGSSSSGTINRGSYIKIGAGYYSADAYYLAQNVSNGTITNNTSGGTSSGTINRGKQIKIGAGYYASDAYYTAQSNSGTLTISASGTTSCNGYANVSVPKTAIIVNVTATSNTTTTISNSNITSNHYVYNICSTIPDSDVTWTTAAGSLTLTCSDGIPAMEILLCRDM